MKAHFKRSLKEYEAKYLKDNKHEKINKPSKALDHTSKAKTDMPKPNDCQEIQHNLTSSVASVSVVESSKKDLKTARKTSNPINQKPSSHRHSTESQAPENKSGSLNSNASLRYSIPKFCDMDAEDNNNELVIDEGDSVIDKDEISSNLLNENSNHSSTERKRNIYVINENENSNECGDEDDIVVDDVFEEQQERRQTPVLRQGLALESPQRARHNTTPESFKPNAECSQQSTEDGVMDMDDFAEGASDEESSNSKQGRFEDAQIHEVVEEEERNRKCNWCQRPGPCSIIMHVSESLEGDGDEKQDIKHLRRHSFKKERKAFCCERCFSLYRRSAFKKNRRCEGCRRPTKQPLLVKDAKHRQFCR